MTSASQMLENAEIGGLGNALTGMILWFRMCCGLCGDDDTKRQRGHYNADSDECGARESHIGYSIARLTTPPKHWTLAHVCPKEGSHGVYSTPNLNRQAAKC